ncbi:MAG: DUF3618 domain-containing protein [Actinobacteria bacterium]|nr:MAG: DUF3618 domain-containing protein [Actinomycetota bacterium]
MGQDPGADSTTVTEPRGPEEIRQDIQSTRHELGDTVAALAYKADVKARTREKVSGAKQSVAHKKDEVVGKAKQASPDAAAGAAAQASEKARRNPLALAAAGAFLAGVLVGRSSNR